VLVGAYAIWSPRQIRVTERGFSARDGVRYHAPVGRLVRYALLQGAVAALVLGLIAGWYSLSVSRVLRFPDAEIVISFALCVATLALYYSLRRSHGLDRRIRTWVYGPDVPYGLWRSVRTSVMMVWVAVGAIALVAAVLPSFVLSIH
jgi:hypothetical protein